jgi:adenine-specific DNA-methyltransferase
MAKKSNEKSVETLTHDEATRKNIPTAEYQSVMRKEDQAPKQVNYSRGNTELGEEKKNRNVDLDPQLMWRGKDQQDWSDLVVNAPPLYIQEKVHPKVLIDDLRKRTEANEQVSDDQIDLFGDFNGLPDEGAKTEFYQHDSHWSNRMILGDSLQVMASLAEREGLREKVQCIYFDPPYGIKFNSNFQWSTTSRDVKDGKAEHITREPEMVKAFRDTWRDGIHSYLTYLRDRLMVARDMLTVSGSIFVQIGDENVHRVRAVMDEVFGDENFVAQITFRVKSPLQVSDLARTTDFLLWYCIDRKSLKFRQPRAPKTLEGHSEFSSALLVDGSQVNRAAAANHADARYFTSQNLASSGYTQSCMYDFEVEGRTFKYPKGKSWKTHKTGMERLLKASRLQPLKTSLRWRYFFKDAQSEAITDIWQDTFAAPDKTYVVQTSEAVVQRCILMTTDPGDLVLDPTCGSGTSAYVAEQWGRRWITIDTSRVSLALARARIMGARYPYYLLTDSREGQLKEAEITRTAPSSQIVGGNISHGFVYGRAPHITLKSIANNTEIDVIWDKFQQLLESLRNQLNRSLNENWQDWEIPREAGESWSGTAKKLHTDWWHNRIVRQQEIDASIVAKADNQYLYDKPYEDKKKVRVAGPFTVESLSPHRILGVDENDELIDPLSKKNLADDKTGYGNERGFVQIILENLKTAGVQQAHKEDKINFTSLNPWPGDLVCAEGRYEDYEGVKRAAVFIGPEFGTVSRPDLVQAAREAGDADFDVLIACAFNYDAHSSEFEKLGRIPVLKARMNADLHMAEDLKNTGKGNLFVIFGEPDIDILEAEDNQVSVKVNGVDVFHPNTGEVRSDGADGIACWFIDTDYNEESFFVRHAYFLGANDPYKSLKTTLKAEINEEAWATLHSDTSRPFNKPSSGRIAVKVINHLGDEVMKVFRVS